MFCTLENSHITLSDELSYMLVHAEYGRNQVGNCVLELWAPGLPGVRVWFLNTSSEYWRQPFVFCMQAGQVRPVPARVTRRCVSQFPMSHSIGLQRSREGLNAGSNMNAEWGVCE